MIFTDKFVYVHEPKTGGTFVTSALLRVHGISWNLRTRLASTLRPQLSYDTPYGRFIFSNNKHGTCREIPAAQKHKLVLATVRNPYDLLVSQYEFGWWKRREVTKHFRRLDDFKKRYASFPSLSFAEFVQLMNETFGTPRTTGEASFGWCTTQFVKYYFTAPERVLSEFDTDYVATREYRRAMFNVHFVRTNELNRGLHDFLRSVGYPPAELSFIFDLERLLPGGKGRSAEQRWEKYYTPELKLEVREKERHLFTIFPEFDV